MMILQPDFLQTAMYYLSVKANCVKCASTVLFDCNVAKENELTGSTNKGVTDLKSQSTISEPGTIG